MASSSQQRPAAPRSAPGAFRDGYEPSAARWRAQDKLGPLPPMPPSVRPPLALSVPSARSEFLQDHQGNFGMLPLIFVKLPLIFGHVATNFWACCH